MARHWYPKVTTLPPDRARKQAVERIRILLPAPPAPETGDLGLAPSAPAHGEQV